MLTDEQIAQQIRKNRAFMKFDFASASFESDQQKKLPQPPLAKPASGAAQIPLTMVFDHVMVERDYLALTTARHSRRVYSDDAVTLDQLAFLLWTTQGVKSIHGDNYATMRPVPSGGARHPFETYLAVRNVEGLAQGIYHYLPLVHALEFVCGDDNFDQMLIQSLCGQKWAAKAAVTFFYSIIPYRCEWRYSYTAHRVALIDAGHVVQNLYLSCEAIGCATCAVAAFDQKTSDAFLRLDGEDEFTVYAAPVGVKRK